MRAFAVMFAVGLLLPLAAASASLPGLLGPGSEEISPAGGQIATAQPGAVSDLPNLGAENPYGSRGPAQAAFDAAVDSLQLDPDSPALPEGLAGLRMLAQQANNTTVIPSNNGTTTHHHGDVGDQGLGPVWAAIFHGIPRHTAAGDVDGDGTLDALVGSDLSVSAFSGKTGQLLWARHLGSPISSLTFIPEDRTVLFSTLWDAVSPRVGILYGESGEVKWEHVGEQAFLHAVPQREGSNSEILAVDVKGDHILLAGGNGEELRRTPTEFLADTTTPVAAYQNDGTYLVASGDVNGDGVVDTVSVALVFYYPAPGLFNIHSVINAVDGDSGDLLWTHFYGIEPLPLLRYSFVLDVHAFDSQGDGSADIAYAGTTIYISPALLATVESHLRVLEGSGSTTPLILGARSLGGPLIQPETFMQLESTDVTGDGPEELAAIRYSVVAAATADGFVYERYAVGRAAAASPTMVVLSDTAVPGHRMHPMDVDGDGRTDHAVVLWGTSATLTLVKADGSIGSQEDFLSTTINGVIFLGENLALATPGEVQLRPAADLGRLIHAHPTRGSPRQMQLADGDGDGTVDVYVLSTDQHMHVIDGLTGLVRSVIPMTTYAESFRLALVDGDDVPDILFVGRVLVDDLNVRSLQAVNGANGNLLYQTPVGGSSSIGTGPGWFDADGDGIPDVVADWEPNAGVDLTSFQGAASAYDGSDGKLLWQATVDLGGDPVFYWHAAVAADLDGDEGQDIVLTEYSAFGGVVGLDGETGKQKFWASSEGQPRTGCAAAVDSEASGTDQVLVLMGGTGAFEARLYDADGPGEALVLFNDLDGLSACDMRAVSDADGLQDILLSISYVAGGSNIAGIARLHVEDGAVSVVWSELETVSDVEAAALHALGADGPAPDGGRVYSAWQDHVFATRWTDGTFVGEFTVNGPFVEAGSSAELDGSDPAEVLILSGDGILWALSEDPDGVIQRLANQANDLGKESAFDVAPSDGKKGGRGIPVVGAPVLLVVLAGLAFRQRRRES